MPRRLDAFELIARLAHAFSDDAVEAEGAPLHPFDSRNLHASLPKKVRNLFDDGHYAEATFAAYKYTDRVVQKHSKLKDTGEKLMMRVFDPSNPVLSLNAMSTSSELDEQRGFRLLFSGGVIGIRNPRGHGEDMADDVDTCLDHLAFASLLLRRLEQAGFSVHVNA